MLMSSPLPQRKNAKKGNGNMIGGGQHIKVFVRVRPMNSSEKSKGVTLVECPNSKEVVVQERPFDKCTKKFSFDRVFDSNSNQVDIYKAVAKPLVEEVLNGFNCTIFAYGQTGTGKTFTMEGDEFTEASAASLDDNHGAGIIPRCVNHLFNELRRQKLEFTMRVSFLELYNEELFDLLSANDDMSRLRIYEDTMRKGSCIIQGLEEVLVRCKSDVYSIIEKGSSKRQTASTMLNAQSSRSHTVFTVTVHIKENTLDGDELLKTGKLHLVDLAGSENIGRSGAVDKRAREAGNINQSLLTLGRVITSLVERAPHVPYRESKLTRLLQDALGGRTKTSIIATVSPASVNLEETLSTLDYAHRAKNIQNKPEVNQKLNKKELIGEYTIEIERLRRDLLAMREKNGVYLANENYQEMIATQEQQAQEISEKIAHIQALEEEMEKNTELFNEVSKKLGETCEKLENTEKHLESTKEVLQCTQKLLSHTAAEREEQKYLVTTHCKTEDKLHGQGNELIGVANTTTSDITRLQDSLDRKRKVDSLNTDVQKTFREQYKDKMAEMRSFVWALKEENSHDIKNICKNIGNCVTVTHSDLDEIAAKVKLQNKQNTEAVEDLKSTLFGLCADILANASALYQIVQEKNHTESESLKLFTDTTFCPSIRKMKELIGLQAGIATRMQKVINEKITNIETHCRRVAQEQISIVSSMEANFQNLIAIEKARTESLVSEIEDMQKQVDSYSELESRLLKQLTEGNGSRRSQLINSLEGIAKVQRANTSKIALLNEKCTSDCSSLKNLAVEHEKSSSEQALETRTCCNSDIDELKSEQKELEEQRSSMALQVEKKQSGVSDCLLQTVGIASHYQESTADVVNSYKTTTRESFVTFSNELTSGSEMQCASLSQEKIRLANSVERISQGLLHNELNIRDSILNHHRELEECEQSIDELFNKQLVKDIPTGLTPSRKEYCFPKTLAITSPHEKLLERHRLRINMCSKIPLPTFSAEHEEGDGLTSNPNSRSQSCNSSPSDIEDNGSALPERGFNLPLTKSGSFQETALLIREPSALALSRQESKESIAKLGHLSRSSSTSSIESKENLDTNSSRRIVGAKRREPRHQSATMIYGADKISSVESTAVPELKPRKVLGSHN